MSSESRPLSRQAIAPKPFPLMQDENARIISWLASAFSPDDIKAEWDYYFEEDGKTLHEQWVTIRWTTPDELADADFIYAEFGDVEMNNVDTSVVITGTYRQPREGAHRYWTVDP